MKMNKKVLKEAGLSEQEIEIYLTLVRLGSITVSRISQETGLHRSNLYDTLEKLQNKGLASHIIKNNIKYYQATHPERLVSYLEERLDNVKSVIPELLKMSALPKEETEVEVFKAREGIKTVFKDIISSGKDFWVYGSAEKFEKLFPIYSKQFFRLVDEKKIKERIIFEQGTKINIKTIKGEYRFISKEHVVPTSFNVYGNNVALFIWTPPMFAIMIKNKDVAETYRMYFKFLWKMCEKE